MKYDMLGAGAVLGAVTAIADLKLPIGVLGLMAIAQNVPSGTSYKPGDVLTAFNGKSIEITNTDAEGRVALADAVSYAAHLGADWIVETSTLTGAAVVALGHEATALVSDDDGLAAILLQSAAAAGERVWRLPAYPEYRLLYRSEIADLKNAPGRDAGAITGGLIVSEFAGSVPFAHLDIAGTAWTDRTPLNHMKNGPTGVMVRTLVELADRLSHS
jgi:leucyl aminopeptidase